MVVLRPAGARERGDGVEGVSFTEFASVQEQVEQIEGRNHTHAVDKRGAHCAVAVTMYHRPRSWAGVIWWLGQPPSFDVIVFSGVGRGRWRAIRTARPDEPP